MSSGSPPQIDLRTLEETRRHINRLIEEVARLTEASLPPVEYYKELLTRVLSAMAAPAGAIWVRTAQGNLQLLFHINLREVGIDKDEHSRSSHDELLRYAMGTKQSLSLLPHSGAGPGEDGRAAPGNPTSFLLLLAPVLLNNEVAAFIEVFQARDRPQNAIPGFLQFMNTMADLAARYSRNQLMGQMAGQQQVWTQLEAFSRLIHATLNPMEVAYHVANEGRRLVDCDRVSVGVRHGRKVKVEAVSGTDVVEKRSNLIVLMRALFDAVLAWGEKLVYFGTKDETLPPKVVKALDEYLAESNSKMLCLIPLKDEREKESTKPARSALLMECFDPADEPQQLVSRLDIVGKHASSALYNAVEYKRIPMRFLWLPLAKVQEGLGGKARAILFLILAALVALVAVMYFVPYPLKMEAKGKLVPVTRRWVYAPTDGTVRTIRVVPNAVFGENVELLQLENREIGMKLIEIDAQRDLAERSLAALRPELGKPQLDAQLKLKVIQHEADLRKAKGAREVLLRGLNPVAAPDGLFSVLSPRFTAPENARREVYRKKNGLPAGGAGRWRVLNSDFRENIAGRQVDPSVPLIRVGDGDSGWEIELLIPQRHLRQVMAAYNRLGVKSLEVDLLVRTDPTSIYRGILHKDRVGGEAQPQRDDNNEVEPVVYAYVTLDDDDIPEDRRVPRDLLVAGTEVLTKVRCGDARMGYSLFYGVWEFICEKVLFFF